MRAHKTCRVETVAKGAATARADADGGTVHAQLCLWPAKTEVFEKVAASFRQCTGVEDNNDNEIMELCILSKKLHVRETTATLIPSRFVSHAAR